MVLVLRSCPLDCLLRQGQATVKDLATFLCHHSSLRLLWCCRKTRDVRLLKEDVSSENTEFFFLLWMQMNMQPCNLWTVSFKTKKAEVDNMKELLFILLNHLGFCNKSEYNIQTIFNTLLDKSGLFIHSLLLCSAAQEPHQTRTDQYRSVRNVISVVKHLFNFSCLTSIRKVIRDLHFFTFLLHLFPPPSFVGYFNAPCSTKRFLTPPL